MTSTPAQTHTLLECVFSDNLCGRYHFTTPAQDRYSLDQRHGKDYAFFACGQNDGSPMLPADPALFAFPEFVKANGLKVLTYVEGLTSAAILEAPTFAADLVFIPDPT
jgi:hypothetical protein